MKSFNTQPPEGGWILRPVPSTFDIVFQHTATRRWLGGVREAERGGKREFQHTATRRWLVKGTDLTAEFLNVSTHSHPKVAGAPAKTLTIQG